VEKFPQRERSAAATLEPRVTAVVVAASLGQGKWTPLELCLRSALAEPSIEELVVVDLDNDPEVASQLRAFSVDRRDVKLVTAPGGATAAAAANLGVQHARGRMLLFLDPGVVLQRGAVKRLTSAGGNAHTPWIVGGRLTDTEGRERRVARAGALTTFSAIAVAMDWRGPQRPTRRRKQPSGPTKVAAVSGALMLMPRSDFDYLKGFDEGFATDAADLDLCRRAVAAGGSVLFLPAAAGVQFEPGGRGRQQAQGLALFATKSAKTPLEKAFALIARPALLVLLALKTAVIGAPPAQR
jgi:GT2 family glycosyltransferase